MKRSDVLKFREFAVMLFIKCLLVLLALVFPSCNDTNQSHLSKKSQHKAIEQALAKAGFYKDRNPDSALILTGNALKLMKNLQFETNDTLYLLLELASNILSRNDKPDSALRLLSSARLEGNTADDKLFQAKIALQLGYLEQLSDKHELSGKHLLEALLLFEKLGRDDLTAEAYNRYGIFLMYNNENNRALEYQLKAYKILDSLKNAPLLCNVCMTIGNIFNAIGSPEQELRYTRLSLQAALLTNDKQYVKNALNNLGVYYRHRLPDSALYYYQRIIALSMPADRDDILSARYNIANLYYDQKKYSKALVVYNEILEQCLAAKIYVGVASACSGIASANNKMGNYRKAIEIIKTAIQYADSTGDKSLIYRLKESMQIFYKNIGNFKDAYLTAMEIKAFYDSTQALEKTVALHELEIRYQTEKKEAENGRLNQEVVHQKQIVNSRAYIIILLFLIALLSVFFSWKGYSLYRERSYAYNILMKNYEDEKAQRDLAQGLQPGASGDEQPPVSISAGDPLIENLIRYYHDEKPYLNPKLRVDEVAARLNTTQKAVAAALKQYNNSNFNNFTNEFRIEEAKRIMENLSDSFYKVESLAYESGFGSKSSFYVAFEQFTGVKPSYYRKFMLDRKTQAS